MKFSGILILLIMACLIFGCTIDQTKKDANTFLGGQDIGNAFGPTGADDPVQKEFFNLLLKAQDVDYTAEYYSGTPSNETDYSTGKKIYKKSWGREYKSGKNLRVDDFSFGYKGYFYLVDDDYTCVNSYYSASSSECTRGYSCNKNDSGITMLETSRILVYRGNLLYLNNIAKAFTQISIYGSTSNMKNSSTEDKKTMENVMLDIFSGHVSKMADRIILGETAKCYKVSYDPFPDEFYEEFCFAQDGLLLEYHVKNESMYSAEDLIVTSLKRSAGASDVKLIEGNYDCKDDPIRLPQQAIDEQKAAEIDTKPVEPVDDSPQEPQLNCKVITSGEVRNAFGYAADTNIFLVDSGEESTTNSSCGVGWGIIEKGKETGEGAGLIYSINKFNPTDTAFDLQFMKLMCNNYPDAEATDDTSCFTHDPDLNGQSQITFITKSGYNGVIGCSKCTNDQLRAFTKLLLEKLS